MESDARPTAFANQIVPEIAMIPRGLAARAGSAPIREDRRPLSLWRELLGYDGPAGGAESRAGLASSRSGPANYSLRQPAMPAPEL